MDCNRLTERIAGFSGRSIHFFDDDGAPCALSFPTFAERAQQIVQRLRDAGLQRGERVGIHAANSVHWLTWDLALLQLGCVIVALPDEIVQQYGAAVFDVFGLRLVVLGTTGQSAQLDACANVTPVDPRSLGAIELRAPAAAAQFDERGADACALAFSSGTSGVPKCLVINRRGIEWDVEHYMPVFSPGGADRLLLFMPLTQQQQRLLAYAAYWHGASIVLVAPERLFDAFTTFQPTLCLAPPLLYEGIHDRFLGKLDTLSAPAGWALAQLRRALVAAPQALAAPLRRMLFKPVHAALGGKMRVLVTGMAPIRRSTLEFFAETGLSLYEAYGLSETGVIASNTPADQRIGAVGKPAPGCTITIADDGEIQVQRQQLQALGYFLPQQGTVDWFERDKPLGTGDIGEFDADGFVMLRGRKKEILVTSQGYKIHPEVVEARLNEAAVIVRSVVFGDARKHLGAVVVVRGDVTDERRASVNAEIERVNRTLHDTAKIVDIVVTNDPFTPQSGLLTANLKLNRRAIEARYFPSWAADDRNERKVNAKPVTPPANLAPADADFVQLVKQAWEHVLDIGTIDVHANFFEIGGDSLCAMRVISRLQGKIVTALQPSDLFVDPTIHAIAAQLTAERHAQARASAAAPSYEEGVL